MANYNREQGPFGKNTHGRKEPCSGECNCCGNAFIDMPETIYARLQVNTFPNLDVYVPLYRTLPVTQICSCTEANPSSIMYASPLFFMSNSAAEDDSVCCGSITLTGTCSGDTCTWQIIYFNPLSAESGSDTEVSWIPVVDAETGDRITCGTLEGVVEIDQYHDGSPCLFTPFSPTITTTITISQTIPGGSAAALCDKLCCGIPLVLYLTINAPDCPELDGQVVILYYNEAEGRENDEGTSVVNPDGEHTLIWRGRLTGCGCCTVPVSLTNNTWSRETEGKAQCRWTLQIGTEHNGICFTDTISEDDNSFCPTDSVFSGTFGENGCETCCEFGPNTITIDVDA